MRIAVPMETVVGVQGVRMLCVMPDARPNAGFELRRTRGVTTTFLSFVSGYWFTGNTAALAPCYATAAPLMVGIAVPRMNSLRAHLS